MGVALAVLAIIAGVRLWTRFGPGWAQPVTGPSAAALLVAVCGLTRAEAGLEASGWWYGVAAAAVIAIGYAVALRIPAARRLFRTTYARPWYTALVSVPLATVVFEEVAFRGVLWGLINRDHGPFWATGATAVLFGLWHLAPQRPWTDALVTCVAAVALGGLRALGGGLIAPALAHWAANGLGVIAARAVSNSSAASAASPASDVDQWEGTQSGAG
jgi:membrane protease YdiL (CAAX protease family)